MKWPLIAIGIVVATAATITLIGAMLPREHVARTTAVITAPVENVWQALTDVSDYPRWRPDVRSVDILSGEGALRWREISRHGSITFERVEESRPRRLVGRIADDKLPFGGTWTYDLEPVRDGTRVTITERGFVTNPVYRVMSRFVFGYHGAQEDFLRALGRRFGQDVALARG
jgi:uncharacterized protein YndB with AHSA1/START domain